MCASGVSVRMRVRAWARELISFIFCRTLNTFLLVSWPGLVVWPIFGMSLSEPHTIVWSIGKCGPTNHIHPIACQKCDQTDCVCPSHLCTSNNKKSAWQIAQEQGTSLCIDQAVHRTQRAAEFYFKHDRQPVCSKIPRDASDK